MGQSAFSDSHSYKFSKRFPFDHWGDPVVRMVFVARDGTPQEIPMVADTGADLTLMPESYAPTLGIADIEDGYVEKTTLGTAGLGSVTAYFHRFWVSVPDSNVYFPMLVGFSRETRSRLLGRRDMVREFVIVFDSRATYFLGD